jgi:3-phenylpropionate/cinnamic acid dioxygenase small subunit
VIDRGSVQQLLGEFAWGLDTQSPDAVLACYEPDARYSITTVDGATIGPYDGHDAIRAHLEGSIGAQTDVRRHVVTNIRVGETLDGVTRVGAYLSLMVTDAQVLRATATGVYTFHVKEGDGVLRFVESNVTLDGGF